MRATHALHERGQSLWLDNITRGMLDSGELQGYIEDYDVTGLTSNPSIFDKAIASGVYNDAIRTCSSRGMAGEELFFELAVEDLRRAADAFLPIHERTHGVDGWVSLEVSPLLAYDTQATIEAAKQLHSRMARPNVLIKIPGTTEGLPAVTDCIASGIPINITLLFSAEHYHAAAEAYLDGVEQRVARGLDPAVGSVASVFMSRWDAAVADRVPAALIDKLGLAIGQDTYRVYREVMDSARMQRLENSGALVQRLLWASTKTKDPAAPDTLYVHCLTAPFTINTMPEYTLKAFFDHGHVGEAMPADGADSAATLARFTEAGVDISALATKLQSDGAKSFVQAWNDLLDRISAQTTEVLT